MHSTSIHTNTPNYSTTFKTKKRKKIGGLEGIYRPISMPYLQQFNALCECSSVKAGFTACSIYVALDSIMMLATWLVESSKIHPGGRVAVVQLNSTDVGLQGVHGLVLLLIENPDSKGKTSQFASLSQPRPMSSVALTSLYSKFLGLRAHTVLKR